jgi:large subunit ribosomal protein L25
LETKDMSDAITLAAVARDRAGKGASRALRREGRVPAVIYGSRQAPVSIHLEEKELVRQLNTGHFMNSVVLVDVGGRSERALPREVQLHPVTDRPIHVDLLRVGADSVVSVAVPVRFVGEEDSPGLKRGGVLNIVRHEVELSCPADAIPDEIVISLAGLEVLDSIHISSVELPRGATPSIDRDFTIATIVAPSALRSAEGAAEGTDEASGA